MNFDVKIMWNFCPLLPNRLYVTITFWESFLFFTPLQEVTLRKSQSHERIGLTVSYSSGNGSGSGSDDADTCTEVYISDIMPDSVAGRDGRLRQGDQILQVKSFVFHRHISDSMTIHWFYFIHRWMDAMFQRKKTLNHFSPKIKMLWHS